MSTSPLSPEEIRAAAEIHQELGPEYSDAVVASFLAKVDSEVAARVEARLASTPQAEPAVPDDRRTLLKGIAIGATASASTFLVAMTGNAGEARHRLLAVLLMWLILAAGYGIASAWHRHQPDNRRTAIDR